MKNQDVLDKIKEVFPDKNFTVEVVGKENILYLDGKKAGVKWVIPTNGLVDVNTIISIIVNNVTQVVNGTVFGKSKLTAKALENRNKPKPAPVKEEKKAEEVKVEEVAVIKEEEIETPAEEPAPKKKKSSKKK